MAGKLLTMLESVDGIDDVGDMDRDVVGGNGFDGGGVDCSDDLYGGGGSNLKTDIDTK